MSDNDKKAAKPMRVWVYTVRCPLAGYDELQARLYKTAEENGIKLEFEGKIYTDKQLEAEREQIARACIIRGWEEACKWYVEVDKRDFHKELIEKERTFNEYWQQKQKERIG